MARKRYKPEEIVSLLRQAEVLHGRGMSMADAIRQLGISEVTFYRWRKEYAGMSGDQLRRLKELEKENERLRRAVSDLTLDKQILKEAAGGNFQAPRAAASASIMSATGSGFRSAGPAECWGSIARPSAATRVAVPTRSAWSRHDRAGPPVRPLRIPADRGPAARRRLAGQRQAGRAPVAARGAESARQTTEAVS